MRFTILRKADMESEGGRILFSKSILPWSTAPSPPWK